MKIYTGNADGESLDKVEEMGLGIMVASSATWPPRKSYSRVPCALDNGAFQCSRRGFPFMESVFLATLDKAYEVGLRLDFIVCPDIVGGGKRSLDFSLTWATGRLATAPMLALAVQDGMEPDSLIEFRVQDSFSHIFIGGSIEWKWKTVDAWVDFAHERGMKAHIGQAGRLQHLIAADRSGADSVDSTSLVRNQSWHIIEEFRSGGQCDLNLEASCQ